MLSEDRIRVYVSLLDRAKVGRIGSVDLDARDPLDIVKVSSRPVLEVGEPGTFDDSGVTPISVLPYQRKLYLYYVGWQLGVKVRYFLFTGLAVSGDGGESFERYSRVPIVERSNEEPFVRSAAHVHRNEGIWRMWYVASNGWICVHGKADSRYNTRKLVSVDDRTWGKIVAVSVSPAREDEFGT